MRRLLLATLFLVPSAAWASLANVYLTQSASGADTGANCANAHAVGFFNTAGNWGAGAAQIGAGTTVHLCGTITAGAGATLLTTQGDGASGNPVTILFEPNAVLSSPGFSGSGAIAINHRFITIDGGTNGTITNTLTGTIGGPCSGGPCTLTADSRLIRVSSSPADLVVKNLIFSNIYIHSSVSDTAATDGGAEAIYGTNHDNLTVDHVTCSNATICIDYWGNNIVISNSTFFKCNRCIVTGSNAPTTGYKLFGNHITHDDTWNTTSNAYHHDGIHAFPFAPGNMSGVQIYNNIWDGGGSGNNTSHIYLQGTFTSPQIFNNVFNNNPNFNMPGFQFDTSSGQSISNPLVVNNTFLGGSITFNGNFDFRSSSGPVTGLTFENNVVTGGQTLMSIQAGTTITVINNNVYQDVATDGGTTNTFGLFLAVYNTLPPWQSNLPAGSGQDSAAVFKTLTNLHLTSDGHLQSGSPAIGKGVNLTGLGIAALNSDKAGIARPSSGAWDAGAYQFSSGAPCSPVISSVSLNPASVVGGNTSTGTVMLSCAPTSDTVVSLSSSNTAVATVPATVTVLANQTTATFTVTTVGVCVSTNITITATLNGSTTASLTVTVGGALCQGAVVGGNAKVSGTAKIQ